MNHAVYDRLVVWIASVPVSEQPLGPLVVRRVRAWRAGRQIIAREFIMSEWQGYPSTLRQASHRISFHRVSNGVACGPTGIVIKSGDR
jgi:hypothetical protein